MSYSKTLDDVISYTGLKEQFIRKCIKNMPEIFKGNISRGDKNSILLNDNSFVIFDKIKQLKDQGQSITSIHQNLKLSLSKSSEKTEESEKTKTSNTEEHKYIDILITELKTSNSNTIKAFEENVKTQKEHIQTLEKQILLITDGRSPEEIKQESLKKDESVLKIQNEVRNKEVEIKSIKMELDFKAKELEEKKLEFEKLKSEQQEKENLKLKVEEEQKKLLNEKAEKKNKLLKEIEALEGKWFVGKKRQELLKELQDLF